METAIRESSIGTVTRESSIGTVTRESSIGTVMIKCPDTGRDIPTGMMADRASFSATPVFFSRVQCPLCNTMHEWFARDAWVCDAVDPPKRLALSEAA